MVVSGCLNQLEPVNQLLSISYGLNSGYIPEVVNYYFAVVIDEGLKG